MSISESFNIPVNYYLNTLEDIVKDQLFTDRFTEDSFLSALYEDGLFEIYEFASTISLEFPEETD